MATETLDEVQEVDAPTLDEDAREIINRIAQQDQDEIRSRRTAAGRSTEDLDAPVETKEPENVQPDADDESDSVPSDEGETPQPEALDAEVESLRAAYGLSKEEVEGYTAADLQRALDLYDRRVYQAGRKDFEFEPEAETQPETPAQPSTPATTDSADDPMEATLKELQELGYEEAFPKAFNLLREQLRAQRDEHARIAAEQRQLAQMLQQEREAQAFAAANREVQRFREVTAELGHPDLFGTPEAQKPGGSMEQLYKALLVLESHHFQQTGERLPVSKATLERAYRVAFPEHHQEAVRKSVVQRASEQSRQRMGSGTSNRTRAPKTWSGDPADNPVILQAWNKLQRDNGNL